MKQIVYFPLVLGALIFSTPVLSQEEKHLDIKNMEEEPMPKVQQEEEIHRLVEQNPEYPGGNAEFYKYIMQNLRYPQECIENNIQGKVYVSFVVEKDGRITSIMIERGIHAQLDQEARRLVSKMPNWSPGKIKDQVVRTKMIVPVSFKLN